MFPHWECSEDLSHSVRPSIRANRSQLTQACSSTSTSAASSRSSQRTNSSIINEPHRHKINTCAYSLLPSDNGEDGGILECPETYLQTLSAEGMLAGKHLRGRIEPFQTHGTLEQVVQQAFIHGFWLFPGRFLCVDLFAHWLNSCIAQFSAFFDVSSTCPHPPYALFRAPLIPAHKTCSTAGILASFTSFPLLTLDVSSHPFWWVKIAPICEMYAYFVVRGPTPDTSRNGLRCSTLPCVPFTKLRNARAILANSLFPSALCLCHTFLHTAIPWGSRLIVNPFAPNRYCPCIRLLCIIRTGYLLEAPGCGAVTPPSPLALLSIPRISLYSSEFFFWEPRPFPVRHRTASGSNYPRAEVNLAIRSYNYGQIFINGISFRILGSFPHTPELLALRTPPLVKVSVCYAPRRKLREKWPGRGGILD